MRLGFNNSETEPTGPFIKALSADVQASLISLASNIIVKRCSALKCTTPIHLVYMVLTGIGISWVPHSKAFCVKNRTSIEKCKLPLNKNGRSVVHNLTLNV